MAHERQEESRPIGKVQVERLSGYMRRTSDLSQRDVGPAALRDQPQGGVEDVPTGRGIATTRCT
jgi:hypothetical protein